MKNKEIVQAEEIAQKILGILDASANTKQWQEMVDVILSNQSFTIKNRLKDFWDRVDPVD